jgi:CMP/dCMP kinase
MKITISGELGAGKTVLGKLLCQKLGYSLVSVGSIQRELAEKHGMTTIEFNKYMETHPEIDHECDNKVREYGQSQSGLVLDSRLAWHFVPDAFKVHLVVDINTAAARIFNDKIRKNENNADLQDTVKNIRIRKASECKRFMEQYQLDIDNLANYDLVVDSSHIDPENLADFVIMQIKKTIETPKPQVWLSPKNLYPLDALCREIPDIIFSSYPTDCEGCVINNMAVQVIKHDNAFFIYNWHDKCRRAIASAMSIMPVEIVNISGSELPCGGQADQYIAKMYKIDIVKSWEEANVFRFADYYNA